MSGGRPNLMRYYDELPWPLQALIRLRCSWAVIRWERVRLAAKNAWDKRAAS